uniref:Uncharacterized protein n=1 Tax=Arundo donax TaxID=35708 RepID=A0A0A8ZU21_ARUDO
MFPCYTFPDMLRNLIQTPLHWTKHSF